MPHFLELDGDQARQLINTEQSYSAYLAAQDELRKRFRGSMAWKTVSGRDYLYRKSEGGAWKSLGPRSAETELILERFRSGRSATKRRIAVLDATIGRAARVNRAMGLGRMPVIAARLLRRLEREQLLGRAISVVGAHALYAYERMAGGHFHRSHVATFDIDLLYEARSRLGLLAPEVRQEGLHGILRSVDRSFRTVARGSYRAVNDKGFMVDLIRSMPANPSLGERAGRIGADPDDMTAAEIEGLSWLQNAPQMVQIVIDERGYPLTLAVPDPRAFALHKLWVSEQPSRDPVKGRRDAEQARAVAALVLHYLPQLPFEDGALRALPASLRARTDDLIQVAKINNAAEQEDW